MVHMETGISISQNTSRKTKASQTKEGVLCTNIYSNVGHLHRIKTMHLQCDKCFVLILVYMLTCRIWKRAEKSQSQT